MVTGCRTRTRTSEVCPRDCGICQRHTSHTALGNIDLTNRCNLTCPICFANANVTGKVYEPTKEQVMRDAAGSTAPSSRWPGRLVQFSGGEPTIHPDFFEILQAAQGDRASATSRSRRTASSLPTSISRSARPKPACTRSTCSSTASTIVSTSQTRGRDLLDIQAEDRRERSARPASRSSTCRRSPAASTRTRSGKILQVRARQHRRLERHQLPAGGHHGPDRL